MRLARILATGLFQIALSVVPALAQAPAVGLEGGMSMSRVSPDAAGQSISRGPGLLAGAYVLVPVFKTVGIQLEAVYAQKNSHLTSTTDLKLDYIEVPILAKLKLIKSAYMLEGVALGFPVRARIQPSTGAETDIKSQVTSPDVAIVIGGGVPIQNFAIEGRYEGGFSNFSNVADAAAQRNRSLSLLVRVHF